MAPWLPFELVIKVIENTYYLHADKHKADVKTLSACAAVCKQWSRFARTLLFFKVNTIRMNRQASVKRISFLPGSGGLGACIRSIALYSHPGPELDFITALSYCPNLYELCLDVNTLELTELEVARLVELRMSIRALRFSFFGIEESRVLYQLMAIWPSIKFLTTTVSPYLMASLPPDRPPFSLYEFSLRGFDWDSYPVSFIRWFLPPVPAGQRGSLRILSIEGDCKVCDTLMEYAPYVRSLRLSCNAFSSHELIERCSMLEELVFDGLLYRNVNSETRALVLPQTIEHLRIAGIGLDRNQFEPFVVALRSSTPRLRQVSVNTNMISYQRDVFVDLAKVCSNRGIALVLDPPRSWMWGWEYLVPVDNFPRHKTVKNLYRMNTNSGAFSCDDI